MKYLYTILAFLVLASCWTESKIETTITENNTATEKTNNDIESEISNIQIDEIVEIENDEIDSKVVKLDATYTNPKTTVDMVVDYTLDDENKIETINVSATTYDLSKFDKEVQVVVWKTLEEASEMYVSGSSLTSAAFKKAIK